MMKWCKSFSRKYARDDKKHGVRGSNRGWYRERNFTGFPGKSLKNALKLGLDIKTISKITGLSMEEIEKLK